ncbi:MAG: hypothetical protein ACXVDN_05655, partial [Ktedonobacteraceae bacterium]
MDENSEATPRGGLFHSLDKIAISVVTLQAGAVAIADVADCPTPRGNRKRTVGSGCHATHMHPLVLQVRRDDRPHDITRPKRVFRARFLGPCAREAVRIHAAHLSALLSHCPDEQRPHVLPEQPRGRRSADVGRVQPVRFGDAALCAVPLGAPTCARLDGKPAALEA